MSNKKHEVLRLSGSTHGARYANIYPVGPSYPEPLSELQAMLSDTITARWNDGYFRDLASELRTMRGVHKASPPRLRSHPHTVPRLFWLYAISFYFGTYHINILIPGMMDISKKDGTYANQHIVLFCDCIDGDLSLLHDEAAQAFVTAAKNVFSAKYGTS